jgi:hypothetical protein
MRPVAWRFDLAALLQVTGRFVLWLQIYSAGEVGGMERGSCKSKRGAVRGNGADGCAEAGRGSFYLNRQVMRALFKS